MIAMTHQYCALYRARNLVNGKEYYGIAVDPKRRWSRHKTVAKKAHPNEFFAFARAINKYGADAFSFDVVLEEHGPDAVAKCKDAEMLVIAMANAQVPNGYNITAGGDGALGVVKSPALIASIKLRVKEQWVEKREIMLTALNTEETKKRISEGTKKAFAKNPDSLKKLGAASKAHWADPEKRQMRLNSLTQGSEKLSASLKKYFANPENRKKLGVAIKAGQDNPETKAKMSASSRKRFKPGGDLYYKVREIVCIETGVVFANQRQAALWASEKGVGWMVAAVANGKRKSAYGHTWKFIEKEMA
jgi:group I intron endonuclease